MSELPIAFEPTRQKTQGDCAVACLKMLLEVDYLAAVAAFPKRANVVRTGVSDKQMIAAAKKLGHRIKLVRDGDLSEVVGVLVVRRGKTHWHDVMLAKGCVYDPDTNLFWTDVAAFLTSAEYTVCGVFMREDS